MISQFMCKLTKFHTNPKGHRCRIKLVAFFLVISLSLLSPAFCVPDDLTVSSFENFKQTVEKEVEEELAEEFKLKEDKINKLSKPFHIGDDVSVSLIQGGRKRIVNGIFRGIKGPNAEIGDRLVLLSDIEELDRDRLFFGGEIQLLQLKVNQRRKEMEEEKDRRRELIINQKYKKAGYTKKFFDNSVELAGRFWPLSDLGDKRVRIRLELDPGEEFVNVAMKYKLDMETSCVVSLDKNPIYYSNLFGDNYKEEKSSFSGTISFQILRSDLGELLLSKLKDRLSVWLIYKDSGFWSLRPVVDKRSQARSNKKRVEYTLRLLKSSVKKSSQQLEQQLSQMINSAKAYQEGVQSKIDALKSQAQREEERRLQEAEEKAAAFAKKQELEKLREQRIERIEKLYSWVTPKTAEKENKTLSSVISLNNFDNILLPSMIDNQTVEKFTEWINIPTDSRILFGTKYRLLKVRDGENEAKFLLHYRASYVNSKLSVSDFVPSITVNFSGGDQETWNDTYNLPAAWAGEFHAAHELLLDKMEKVIKTVVIERPSN